MKVIVNGINAIFYKKCSVTGKKYSVTVNKEKYIYWKTGNSYIQEIFPELNADQREFLISGTTPQEWSKMFREEAL